MLQASAGVAALSAGAFLELSQKDNSGTEQTGEHRMLELSRAEIKKGPRQRPGAATLGCQVVLLLELYVWEPIWTGVRFLQLGGHLCARHRLRARHLARKHTAGTATKGAGDPLVVNKFLVNAMEWAGPAFISSRQWAASLQPTSSPTRCETMSKLHSNAPAHRCATPVRPCRPRLMARAFDDIFRGV